MKPVPVHLLQVTRATRPLPGQDGGLAFASNQEGHQKTYYIDRQGGEARTIADSGDRTLPEAWATPCDFWDWEDWSPDGSRAAVLKIFGAWTEAYILERGGALTRLLPEARRGTEISWPEGGML